MYDIYYRLVFSKKFILFYSSNYAIRTNFIILQSLGEWCNNEIHLIGSKFEMMEIHFNWNLGNTGLPFESHHDIISMS